MSLFFSASERTPIALRDQAILALLYSSGLRLAELAALDINDLVLVQRGGQVNVMGKAGQSPRTSGCEGAIGLVSCPRPGIRARPFCTLAPHCLRYARARYFLVSVEIYVLSRNG